MSNPYFDVDVRAEMPSAWNRVRNQLRGLASRNKEITDPVVEAHATWFAKKMRQEPYPAMLPNQKYRRTYELQRRFRKRSVGGKHGVNNYAPHAKYVIKKGYQNRLYHEWRWWTIEDKRDESIKRLTIELTNALEKWMENQ